MLLSDYFLAEITSSEDGAYYAWAWSYFGT